jgi:transposase
MNKRTYRKFSTEFKREAVRLAEQTDGPITQVERELGFGFNQIYKWRRNILEKQDDAFPGSG